MAQSLAKILLHTVFSTKERRHFFRDELLREELHRYLGGILTNLGCQPLIIGGVEDHVHLALTLPRTLTQSDLVKELKTSSNHWLEKQSASFTAFAWQRGYGIFSIGKSQLQALVDYIDSQEKHHRVKTFQEDFRAMLDKYGAEYDEAYVWV